MPLTEVWDDSGARSSERIRDLDQSGLHALMRSGPVQFVVATPGLRLNWIPVENRFDFWKKVRPQIAAPAKRIYLRQFPNETAYVASEWRGRTGECLILLETFH
jgi:hypothetical protein